MCRDCSGRRTVWCIEGVVCRRLLWCVPLSRLRSNSLRAFWAFSLLLEVEFALYYAGSLSGCLPKRSAKLLVGCLELWIEARRYVGSRSKLLLLLLLLQTVKVTLKYEPQFLSTCLKHARSSAKTV